VLVIDGVVGFEMVMPCQVFGSAGHPRTEAQLYEVRVCGDQGGVRATAAGLDAFGFVPPYPLAAALDADTVIVPASDRIDAARPAVLDTLRGAHDRGARIASICTGAYLLAAAGLLAGRRAATHWAHAADFARRHPDVQVDHRALYVDDGDVLTSAGVTAGLDLCLHLVRRDHGAEVAASTARRLVMAPHRLGTQDQFIQTPSPIDDQHLGSTLDWLRAHLTEPITLADIAEHASLSTRSLNRRFRSQTGTTPIQWLIRQRLHRAQELLETTGLAVEQVAAASGFGTAIAMRQHFNRTLGTSPQLYRRTFRAGRAQRLGRDRRMTFRQADRT
jgi:transcriptional regulator GlxA family with amidase domain